MSNEDQTNVENAATSPAAEQKHGPGHKHDKPKHKRHMGRKLGLAGAAVALLAVGGGVGATAVSQMRPAAQMAPLAPVAITAMEDGGIVTIKGTVAEIYGNKFILQDDSGRALVETGPAGESGKLVDKSEPVSVQGRFDNGFMHAAFIVKADGKTEALGGLGPHEPHRHGPERRSGPMDGPDARPDALNGPDDPAKRGGPL